MTLAEVAERCHEEADPEKCFIETEEAWGCGARWVLAEFERDPDFTLRARIEKMAEEFSYRGGPGPMVYSNEFARRLREVLEGK